MGFFPVDSETLRYLQASAAAPRLWSTWSSNTAEPSPFSLPPKIQSPPTLLSMTSSWMRWCPVLRDRNVPRICCPSLRCARIFNASFETELAASAAPKTKDIVGQLTNGSVVIAAITSCTNTSNPDVMIGAGLLARKARERGLTPKSWVKTSLAPGSRVVTRYP